MPRRAATAEALPPLPARILLLERRVIPRGNAILTGKTAWRVHERVPSGLLIDGRDYYRAFYEAALHARRSILLLGWQFDSDVALLRGDDVPPGTATSDVELLPFLNRICRERPELEIRILAWDYSVVFTLEREMLQKVIFGATTCSRFHFAFDDTVSIGGSHHQKAAILDGRIAFVGSMDLCQSRWDASEHAVTDPRRSSRFGVLYKPYHEVQAAVAGPVVRALVELFVERWRFATGEVLDVGSLRRAVGQETLDVPTTLPLPLGTVGISRTIPALEDRETVHEVRALLVRAIREAEEFLYIETQYFTSCTVRDALLARLRNTRRSPLEIVLVLPNRPEKFKEEITIAAPQAAVLRELVDAATKGGHAIGVFNVAAKDEAGNDVPVYIHSKLTIVDDRFMTVGSANLTNRSMNLDTELNVSWEARHDEHAMRAAIRQACARLLGEHVGDAEGARLAIGTRGTVARLHRLVDEGRGRLRRHVIAAEPPSSLAKAVQDFACEVLDPSDGAESLPPSGRTPSAA